MTKEITFNLNALTKPSQVLRKAAEWLQKDTEAKTGNDQEWRDGCCCAIGRIKDAAVDANWNASSRGIKQQSVERRIRKANQTIKAVEEAKKVFDSYYMPKNAIAFSYWFGKARTDEQQQHRIIALLTVAEVLEAEGK